jgi:hypothetical protein
MTLPGQITGVHTVGVPAGVETGNGDRGAALSVAGGDRS